MHQACKPRCILEPSTINCRRKGWKSERRAAPIRKIRLKRSLPCPGPLPPYDHCGYEVAMQIVLSSRGAGCYSPSHKQWDTVRKLWTCFSNHVRAAAVANYHPMTLADHNGSVYQRMSIDPCGSLWFQRFVTGCRRRMGQDWRPNQAINTQSCSRWI